MSEENKAMSPCNSNCVLDPVSSICRGCFRTIAEIMNWPLMQEEDKLLVLVKVGERMSHYFK